MMAPTVRPLLIPVAGLRLVGSLHQSVEVTHRVAVVFVTGGMQTRAGSHRAFLLLSRRFAQEGHAVLRFDLPGLGDSEGVARSFGENADCVRAAIDTIFAKVTGVEQVMLWGLCDGATAAALYAGNDKRVAGLFLVNPWVHTEQVHAQAMVSGYYRRRFLSPDFWRKLLRGKVGIWASAREYLVSWRRARDTSGPRGESLPERVLRALMSFQGQVQIVVSAQDMTGQAFLQVVGDADLQLCLEENADHTFSSPEARGRLEKLSLGALERLSAA